MGRKNEIPDKSPVEATEFSGLQVDTRPKPPSSRLKPSSPRQWHDDADFNFDFAQEKSDWTAIAPPVWQGQLSPQGTLGNWTNVYGTSTLSPTTPAIAKPYGPPTPPPAKEKRICGLRKKHFRVIIWSLLVSALIIGATIGGVLGSRNREDAEKPDSDVKGNGTLPSVFPAAQQADVMIGSPLCLASYDLNKNDTNDPNKDQEFRMYFQSLYGNIKEAISSGSSSWQNARPILTDALNNTGLATLTYLNGSQQQGSIFYVGSNGLLQEKRKIYSDDNYWQPGTLNSLNVPMTGDMTANVSNDDPVNSWDSYRFAAVYSANFSGGPGARLFYHAQALNGSNFVQELIWKQRNDTWLQGATIPGANPNSHLTATVDDSVGVLRLFFSVGNRSLQEIWTSTTRPGAAYSKTVRVDNFLPANNADLAAVSANGTAHLFHYAPTAQGGIRELVINGSTSSAGKTEDFNLTEPLVASPFLPGGTNASLYQPISASITAVRNLSAQLLVFWADKPTGDPTSNTTGYQSLNQVSRSIGSSDWSGSTQIQVPLGSENSAPH